MNAIAASLSSFSVVSRVAATLALAGVMWTASAAPLALHPENPHYFLYKGRPAVLITSGEHYGAVLNLDFDYVKYLDTLQADGLNLTRTFTGAYVEPSGAFNIAQNTLAPAAQRYIAPWARSTTPGYAQGGNKFDLNQWDKAYFKRLKDFVAQAAKRGVIVEMNLFCPFYDEAQWAISPMNSANNINGLAGMGRTNVYTLRKDNALLPIQEALVRKIVTELKTCDNVYYEICNEPYFGGVTLEWQHRIADVIVETEKNFPGKHLISQNIANDKERVVDPHPGVSIFNFHYASPPETVFMNYGLNKVIGDNETGFKGTNNTHYRREGWEFILAGGALYNNLDYSFTVGHEDGTFVYPESQPGGGNADLRHQLKNLKTFIEGFNFVRMKPMNPMIRGGVPENAVARALGETGRAYALFIRGGHQAQIRVDLPAGGYRVEWYNVFDGKFDAAQTLNHRGGVVTLASPEYQEDIALKITATSQGITGPANAKSKARKDSRPVLAPKQVK